MDAAANQVLRKMRAFGSELLAAVFPGVGGKRAAGGRKGASSAKPAESREDAGASAAAGAGARKEPSSRRPVRGGVFMATAQGRGRFGDVGMESVVRLENIYKEGKRYQAHGSWGPSCRPIGKHFQRPGAFYGASVWEN